MPLRSNLFKSWIKPVRDTFWMNESQREEIKILGVNIRQYLRDQCLPNQVKRQDFGRTVNSNSHPNQTSPTRATAPGREDTLSGGIEMSTNHRFIHQTVEAAPAQLQEKNTTLSTQTFIATLIYAMGNEVPKIVFDRATLPQARWNEQGEFSLSTTEDPNLHRDLRTALSDATVIHQSLSDLINSQSGNRVEMSEDQHTIFMIEHSKAQALLDGDRGYWISRAFELCCYVFPRDAALEPS